MPNIASLFPKVIAMLIIFLAVILLFKSRLYDYDEKLKPEFHFKIILKAVLGITIYILILEKVGYLISTFLLVAYMMYILNYPNKKLLVIISLITTILIYVVFRGLLNIPLPVGFIQ